MIFSQFLTFFKSKKKNLGPIKKQILLNFGVILFFSILNYLIEYLGTVSNISLFKSQFQMPDDHKLNFGNTLYFTLITHFTVGYGDYFPRRHIAKWVTAFHVFMAWYINFF